MKTLMELGSLEALKGVVVTGIGFAIVSRASVGGVNWRSAAWSPFRSIHR